MSVFDNVAFGLEMKRLARSAIVERVGRTLELVRLAGFDTRRIDQLSGGQKQRVAMARALVNDPSVLLLDEPLGALDLQLRLRMQEELRRLHKSLGNTFIFVTHDQGEAMAMSDRIAVMDQGRVLQVGTPEEIYESPKTRFVADFVGHTNVFDGRVEAVEANGECLIACEGVSFRCRAPSVRPRGRRAGLRRGALREHRHRARRAAARGAGNRLRGDGDGEDLHGRGVPVRDTNRRGGHPDRGRADHRRRPAGSRRATACISPGDPRTSRCCSNRGETQKGRRGEPDHARSSSPGPPSSWERGHLARAGSWRSLYPSRAGSPRSQEAAISRSQCFWKAPDPKLSFERNQEGERREWEKRENDAAEPSSGRGTTIRGFPTGSTTTRSSTRASRSGSSRARPGRTSASRPRSRSPATS